MIELQEHNGKLKIENYGLMEWATDVQSAIQQGYEIDTSNEGYPQNFGSLYTCLMVESVSAGPVQNQAVKHNELLAEEVQYLRKELKKLQERTTSNGLVLTVTQDKDERVHPDGGEVIPTPVNEVKDESQELFVIAPFDGTLPTSIEAKDPVNVAEKETEVDQPAKRGPKPKNK